MGSNIYVNQSSEITSKLIEAVLTRQGYHVMRSFDLQSALSYDRPLRSSPAREMDGCPCQYTVLLVYPPARLTQPMQVVTIQGLDHSSIITLLYEPAAQGEARETLWAALQEAMGTPASFEPVEASTKQLATT